MSNKCKHFELSSLLKEGRRRYKLDQHPWIFTKKHVVEGVEEGKKVLSAKCLECKETFEDMHNAYLTSRLESLGLDAENGVNKLFCKSGVPGKISYYQFLRCLLGSHGQAGSGVRRPTGVSVKMPCTNQCSRPSVDLKEVFPHFSGEKEIHVSKVAALLDVISVSQNPAITFNLGVLKRVSDQRTF